MLCFQSCLQTWYQDSSAESTQQSLFKKFVEEVVQEQFDDEGLSMSQFGKLS